MEIKEAYDKYLKNWGSSEQWSEPVSKVIKSELLELLSLVAENAHEAGYKANRSSRLHPFDKIAKAFCNSKFKKYWKKFTEQLNLKEKP